ncbi:NUDIX hydrolase [Chthonobacter albigriseus]|uniref:NUDIX hydrolase n=1 Tax=Chthonobacter albigriseus TaxID=1683161 RepID=UPI0015EEAFEC|nr:NUDIX domain-containing protein [Chthonobacter albigriseus]
MTPAIGPRLAVSAGVWRQGRVLLIRRLNPPLSDLWTFPGGHVEPGETMAEALRREVLEETGLAVEPVGEPFLHEILRRDPAGALLSHHVLLVFAARPVDDSPAVAATDAAAAAFVAPADLHTLATTPRLAHFVAVTAARFGLILPPDPE